MKNKITAHSLHLTLGAISASLICLLLASGQAQAAVYTPQPLCAAAGHLETFGVGIGRSPLPAGVTNYTYVSSGQVQDGTYALVDQSTIASAGSWWIVDDDHTPNDTNGKMFLVNADENPVAGALEFYRQNLTGLEIDKQYALSAYIANADNSNKAVRIHPNVKLSVESGAVITSVDTGEILRDPGGDELVWKEYRLLFTATQTSVDIVLTNAGAGGSGNDLVIDDISVYETCKDYGDAPVTGSSPNAGSNNNYGVASHAIFSGNYIGSGNPDADSANQPNADATGDDADATGDDEDGISIPTLTQGSTSTISATVAGDGGFLQGWIDFDGNGTFDAGEKVANNLQDGGALDTNGTVGVIDFDVSVPTGGVTGNTFTRFRWSTTENLDATTSANDGEVEDYAVTIARLPGTVNCGTEVGSAGGSGYATSGSGLYLNEIFWLDWSCAGETKFLAGDTVIKSWEVGSGLTITATVSDITQDIRPYTSGDWRGDFFKDYYSGVNPVGLANQTSGTDTNFNVSFSTTLNGVTIPSDIVIADVEDLDGSEVTTITANGDSFQTLDASGSIQAAFGGGGGAYTVTLSDPNNAGGGTLVAMSRGATNLNVDIGARGISASGFGVMLPFDYGDSPISTTASHYLRPSATGGSQPTTATAAADLTLATIAYGDETYLGSTRADAESSSNSGATATGDDLAGTDDEDGISAFPILSVGATSYELPGSNITVVGTGTLHGWIDFNNNGAFESTEYASIEYTSTTVANDPATKLSWTTLGTMTAGTTFARFRFTSDTLTDDAGTTTIDERSVGSASNGEIEDYVVTILANDYGDAPASYGEAAHKIPDTPVVYLGDVAPDHEPQIQHTANGGSDGAGDDLNGSDDEDAYEKLPAVWTSQSSYRLRVACSDQGAYVAGWVDFNQNNQFDAGERNTNYPTQCNSSGDVTLNWTGLSGLSTGNTYARLRIGSESDEVSTATGTASDGEVEDYPIVLQAPGTPPGACNGELSWLNLAGQPAYPAANWNVNWADRGLSATLDFSTTMTGSNDKWTSATPRVFTESNFINRFGSPGYALGLNRPGDGSGTGSTIANIGFDAPLPANTYMVVRDIDATNESITFSNNSLGSLPAPSLWETQSTAELNANAIENPSWNNPSLFAAWDATNQALVTLSDGPNNDQEAYVWPVAGLTDIRVTYQTYAGSANVGFVSCIPQDYGDAPDSYLTTKSSAGPQHGIINGVRLGANTPDTDTDGQPSAAADGDGADEDGLIDPPTLTSSDRSVSATVSVSNDTANPATLVGWIDFDNNGTLDADEAAIRTIAAGSSNASYTLNWSNIPVDIQTGDSYLRLRLTTDALSNREPGGAKRDGEVEDYLINIKTAGVMVSGRVFNDANVDAVNDSGEIGVTQLPVVLVKIEADTANNSCVSTRTDGAGYYAFKDVTPGTYQVYEASRESVPVPRDCGTEFAKDPSGYRSTTNNVRDEFTVTTSDITGQDFGDVKLPVFEPDNSGQILPGNVLFYAHKFTTPAAGNVSFTSVSSTHRSSGWSSIIYRDENCDGKLNQSDGASPLGTGPVAVNANDNICLVNKVYAPSNVAANDQYIQNITADFDFENAIAGNVALTVRDVTTAQQVQAPALPATPEVIAEPVTPAQDPVDATPTTPYIPEIPEAPAQAQVDPTPVTPAVGPSRLELRKTVKNITQGTAETETVNSAEPGDILEYRIYYSNTGTGSLTDLVVNDWVPAYTELDGALDCGAVLTGMSCTTSPVGSNGSLQWNFTGAVLGGAGSSVSYRVTIDE